MYLLYFGENYKGTKTFIDQGARKPSNNTN